MVEVHHFVAGTESGPSLGRIIVATESIWLGYVDDVIAFVSKDVNPLDMSQQPTKQNRLTEDIF